MVLLVCLTYWSRIEEGVVGKQGEDGLIGVLRRNAQVQAAVEAFEGVPRTAFEAAVIVAVKFVQGAREVAAGVYGCQKEAKSVATIVAIVGSVAVAHWCVIVHGTENVVGRLWVVGLGTKRLIACASKRIDL